MSRYDNRILHELINNIQSDKEHLLFEDYKEALSKVKAVHVINRLHFDGVTDYIWYIGKKTYVSLIKCHAFKYMSNLRSLRLHYVITQNHILYKLKLEDDYTKYQHYKKQLTINRLPDEIGELKELVTLDLSMTNIDKIPDSVANLTNLEYLFLDNTQIEVIPSWISKLNKLHTINLSNLKMHSLPKTIIDLRLPFKNHYPYESWEKGVFLEGSLLMTQPISLFYQKRELIEQYYNEDLISVNSAKVVLLGDGSVGKTYTLKRLLNNGKKETDRYTYPTKTTHGVLIKPYVVVDEKQKFTIKIWDFGGQHIMHSMHRCFLTERTCYVIVLSTRTDRNLIEQARYWLRTVNSFAPSSPVIILVNQWTNNLVKLDDKRLTEEGFMNIQDVLHFSAVDSEDDKFLLLRDAIIKQIHNLDSYGMKFPRSWYAVMQTLENESEHYLSKAKYHLMCFEKGLKYDTDNGESIYEWLLDWFNDLGVCFSYHKNTNIKRLADYNLLNPQWLTRAAYVLINEGEDKSENGIITIEKIRELLKNTSPLDFDGMGSISYEPNEVEYVLEILRKFWISYQLPGNKELIPVLCNEQSDGRKAPDWYDPSNKSHHHTAYELEYSYLPESIVQRLMIFCYQGHYIVRHRWRKGMVVDFDESASLTAVVDAGGARQSITINLYSDGRSACWSFLQKLRDEILLINAEMNLAADDYIIMETNNIQDRFLVKDILNRRAKGKTDCWASNLCDDYKITDILGSAYGFANASIIEDMAETENVQDNIELLNEILKLSDIIMQSIGGLSKQIAEYHDENETNQEAMLAILNTMNKKKTALQSLKDKLLSGVSISADMLALVQFANPGLAENMLKSVSEMMIQILPTLFSSGQ